MNFWKISAEKLCKSHIKIEEKISDSIWRILSQGDDCEINSEILAEENFSREKAKNYSRSERQ